MLLGFCAFILAYNFCVESLGWDPAQMLDGDRKLVSVQAPPRHYFASDAAHQRAIQDFKEFQRPDGPTVFPSR
jgi:hypothetical protein